MDYRYDLQGNVLYMGETPMPAYSLEENEIGTCTHCDSPMVSISYHVSGEEIVVATKCTACGVFYAIIYGPEWNWLDEAPISLLPVPIPISNPVVRDLEGLEAIPLKKMEAVFSKGEIEALFAKAREMAPIRQHLYRARKKYGQFEEIFELRLEL
ncbi:hypothetical protein MSMTP_1630 [Methanosarcina sp. MTP4]|uniref:hypothetical protein n=1 Tax=Methanosarcina sp. MTP4 TaxID=1434100 RepID=UPI00061594E0|nr:hypothetical protein [Methanosarcina sp. MTP4]AKB25099.1 hypothetical protein MSMTP_1630 [Methanosarcina sp. MTP4]